MASLILVGLPMFLQIPLKQPYRNDENLGNQGKRIAILQLLLSNWFSLDESNRKLGREGGEQIHICIDVYIDMYRCVYTCIHVYLYI